MRMRKMPPQLPQTLICPKTPGRIRTARHTPKYRNAPESISARIYIPSPPIASNLQCRSLRQGASAHSHTSQGHRDTDKDMVAVTFRHSRKRGLSADVALINIRPPYRPAASPSRSPARIPPHLPRPVATFPLSLWTFTPGACMSNRRALHGLLTPRRHRNRHPTIPSRSESLIHSSAVRL